MAADSCGPHSQANVRYLDNPTQCSPSVSGHSSLKPSVPRATLPAKNVYLSSSSLSLSLPMTHGALHPTCAPGLRVPLYGQIEVAPFLVDVTQRHRPALAERVRARPQKHRAAVVALRAWWGGAGDGVG